MGVIVNNMPNYEPSSLLQYLVAAQQIVVFTGAGVSTAAGIPDYRGAEGVWKTRPEITIMDFLDDPEKQRQYWQYKSEDWSTWSQLEPTPVHRALLKLEQMGKLAGILTQNIDSLHRKAGSSEEYLVEMHGRMDEVNCTQCEFRGAADEWYTAFLENGESPRCPECGGWLKPGVVMFGESLNPETMLRAQQAMQAPDLVIALGSTLSVQPAASFPLMAARAGIPYIIVNQGETAHDGLPHVSIRLEGDVQELFAGAVDEAALMFG